MLPPGWLAGLPGRLMVAADATVLGAGEPEPDDATLRRLFDGPTLVASHMAGGGATVWTDFLLGADGGVRFLLRDRGIKDAQRGRAAIRLLEDETYSMDARQTGHACGRGKGC